MLTVDYYDLVCPGFFSNVGVNLSHSKCKGSICTLYLLLMCIASFLTWFMFLSCVNWICKVDITFAAP